MGELRPPKTYRRPDTTHEVYKIFRKKLRQLKRAGWEVYADARKPTYNTGWAIFSALLRSPTGEEFDLRHDDVMWVYPGSGSSGHIHERVVISKRGGPRVEMKDKDFLRNPDKIFGMLDEAGARLASTDRSRLIRLAAGLDKGSPEKRAILAGLARTK